MEVVLATDTHYVKYACAMLLSLLDHHPADEPLHVHLLGVDLQTRDIEYLTSLVDPQTDNTLTTADRTLIHYPIPASLLQQYPYGEGKYITLTTWSRMYIGELLPLSVEKVLYLDCDIIVRGNLLPLWNLPLEDSLLAATEDLCSNDQQLYTHLGLIYPPSDCTLYFNAGVLLINLNKWRAQNVSQQAIDIISQKGSSLKYADQDVLNIIAQGQVKYFSARYNLMEGLIREEIPLMRPVGYRDIDQEIEHAVVIHFTNRVKPWSARSFHPYTHLFYYYYDKTRWSGERPTPTLSDRLWRMAFIIGYKLNLVNHYRQICYGQL